MPATAAGTVLGYARVSTGHQSLDQQSDALTAAGVDPHRIYNDKLSGTTTREQRPGLAALLDYARESDVIVVLGIDRLGRSAGEVMSTVADLLNRGIIIRASVRVWTHQRLPGVRCWASWRHWLNSNLSWAGNAVPPRVRHAKHEGRQSVAPKH